MRPPISARLLGGQLCCSWAGQIVGAYLLNAGLGLSRARRWGEPMRMSATSPAVPSWEMEVVPTVVSVLAPAAVGFDGGAGDVRRVR
jgi:hypothetical protein